ncbi:LysE family translocator [Agarilytica rhodophyticola]|uniref:LysE family translocator n=1 Tax=Agarilytica rhodophyticola TaxID=1737490 RepID=UPI000B3476E8|nr:LysE family translocator [Agarilytica rhodophyticola]
MIAVEVLLGFITASFLLALVPGPDNIFVLTQAAVNGRVAGVFITLGLCSGLVLHTAAVALGVVAIFQSSPLAFSILKVLGAAYLLYLAWLSFKAGKEEIDLKNSASLGLARLYLRGFIMNITNPKVAVFFLAFLPQFTNVNAGPLMPQIIFLGVIFMVVALFTFSSIAVVAGSLGGWLRRSERAQQILNRVAGVVFVGLALKLVTAER